MKNYFGNLLGLLASTAADDGFALLYGEDEVKMQKQRYRRLIEQADDLFPDGEAVFVSAPGRTELGGNHTDHNNGRVLAAAINLDCVALVTPDSRNMVNLNIEKPHDSVAVDLETLSPRPQEKGTAAALIRGVAAACLEKKMDAGGFQGVLHSSCPFGAGLSSSASFSVFAGGCFSLLHGKKFADPVLIAKMARDAENRFFGKPCGLMDQLASAVGKTVFIDFENLEEPEITTINTTFDGSGYQLAVIDTGGSHAQLTHEYAAIPEEMKKAARILGSRTGRGLTLERLLANVARIRDNAGDRAFLRLLHFIHEDQRAGKQAEALTACDFSKFLELVDESGRSSLEMLQNCSSATTSREQGILMALALSRQFCPEAICRVHGGGFAGTIQVYVPKESFPGYTGAMEEIFGQGSVIPIRTGRPGVCALTAEGWVFPERWS